MITLLFGENNYQLRQRLKNILDEFEQKEAIERFEGDSMSSQDFSTIFSGLSLFASHRLIIITDLSSNKDMWSALAEQLNEVSLDTHLVIVEESPDKRTKTFKELQKKAEVFEAKNLNEAEVLAWVLQEAEKKGSHIDKSIARGLIDRVGLDQWQLHFALEKLQGISQISHEVIRNIVEASAEANVFATIDAVLNKQPRKAQELLVVLRNSEDAYFFFGLLANQLFQLLALVASTASPQQVAGDLKVHPYPLQKMQQYAKNITKSDMAFISNTLAECDDRLKRSATDRWIVLEQAVVKLASR